MKNTIIFGVTGQSGSWLSDFLLSTKEYDKVIGVTRRSSVDNTERLKLSKQNKDFLLIEGDVTDPSSINHIVAEYQPYSIFSLAAQSHVATSFEQPAYTFQVNTIGVLNVLEAIRILSPKTRMVQASSSEMFGDNYSTDKQGNKYQDENTCFSPCSPYAISKVATHYLVHNYRKAYNLHLSCAIMFNHESERRGEKFVTRKITKYVAKLYNFLKNSHDALDLNFVADYPKLRLGNLDARRDWGYAPDYMLACYLICEQDEPGDYIISTGENYSIKDFLNIAFSYIGISDWQPYVVVDKEFYRPIDVEFLQGDSSKIRKELNWKPSITFKEMVEKMIRSDINNES